MANPAKATRQAALAAHLRHVAANANQMVHRLEDLASRIAAGTHDADDLTERPEFLFEEGIDAVENFVRNISFVTAARLMARYATTKPTT